jgi:hypothetical protein
MSPRRTEIVLSAACGSALVALALIVWSLFDPRPFQVVAAMSIGQAIGTLSFAAFGYVAISDIRGRLAARAPTKGESSS